MFKRLFILLWVVFAAVPALAQTTPPDPINTALIDLSNRVGRTVTLTQVTEWNYQQSVYPSPALGCPQPGIAYTDVLTSGFQFIITYDGTVYDYRVSDDKSIVVLCGTAPAPASVPPCPPSDDPAFLAPRLTKGIKAHVVAAGLPNVIREQPGSSSRLLGQIPAGDPFIVIDGPRCTLLDKIVWWQINYNNLIGWTGEGQDGTYWLEPADIGLTPTAATPQNVTINNANAAQLSAVLTTNGPIAVSADGKTYASASDNKVILSDITTQTQIMSFTGITAKVSSLAFISTGTVVAVGLETGEIDIFNVNSQNVVRKLTGHTGTVTALAYSNDGTLLASSGTDQSVRIWDLVDVTALVTLNTNNAASIINLSFTPNDLSLLATDTNGGHIIFAVKSESVG